MDNSPISDLPEDVLLLIFGFNAVMGSSAEHQKWSTSALGTTYRTSQVCQGWRSLLLNSPTTWASLIDLDSLVTRPHLMKEIIRRTSSMPLLVKGNVDGISRDIQHNFASFMNVYWSTIRSIDVTVINTSLFDDEIWDILRVPSPNIEVFRMDLRHAPFDSPVLDAHPPTFTFDAPMLRSFYAQSITINLDSPWFAHVRDFHLVPGATVQLPLSKMISALSRMHLLESLQLEWPCAKNALRASVSEGVNFPRLRFLKLVDQIDEGSDILQYLIIPPDCSFKLVLFDHSAPAAGISTSLRHRLSTLCHSNLRHRPAKAVDIHIGTRICNIVVSSGASLSSEDQLAVGMSWLHDKEQISDMLNLFAFGELSSAVTLNLEVDFVTDDSFGHSLVACLLNSLRSLTKLTTTSYTLSLMTSFISTPDAMHFPLLKILRLKINDMRFNVGTTQLMQHFMSRREDMGCSQIDILDLTLAPMPPLTLDFLDKYTGLRVLWKELGVVSEYICGSGNPGALNFCGFPG